MFAIIARTPYLTFPNELLDSVLDECESIAYNTDDGGKLIVTFRGQFSEPVLAKSALLACEDNGPVIDIQVFAGAVELMYEHKSGHISTSVIYAGEKNNDGEPVSLIGAIAILDRHMNDWCITYYVSYFNDVPGKEWMSEKQPTR